MAMETVFRKQWSNFLLEIDFIRLPQNRQTQTRRQEERERYGRVPHHTTSYRNLTPKPTLAERVHPLNKDSRYTLTLLEFDSIEVV